LPTRSSSSPPMKLHSSPAISSTSTAVKLTDSVQARRFAPCPVEAATDRRKLIASVIGERNAGSPKTRAQIVSPQQTCTGQQVQRHLTAIIPHYLVTFAWQIDVNGMYLDKHPEARWRTHGGYSIL
jgi:hypothetical protein